MNWHIRKKRVTFCLCRFPFIQATVVVAFFSVSASWKDQQDLPARSSQKNDACLFKKIVAQNLFMKNTAVNLNQNFKKKKITRTKYCGESKTQKCSVDRSRDRRSDHLVKELNAQPEPALLLQSWADVLCSLPAANSHLFVLQRDSPHGSSLQSGLFCTVPEQTPSVSHPWRTGRAGRPRKMDDSGRSSWAARWWRQNRTDQSNWPLVHRASLLKTQHELPSV